MDRISDWTRGVIEVCRVAVTCLLREDPRTTNICTLRDMAHWPIVRSLAAFRDTYGGKQDALHDVQGVPMKASRTCAVPNNEQELLNL